MIGCDAFGKTLPRVAAHQHIGRTIDVLARMRSRESFEIGLHARRQRVVGGILATRKKGALHDAHRRYFGKPGPILVWKAPTRLMNPSVPQRLIDNALERDRAAASSEWLAEFRNDIAAFVPREVVQGVR